MLMVKQNYVPAPPFFFLDFFWGSSLFFLDFFWWSSLFFFLLGIPTVHSRALEGLWAVETQADAFMGVAGASTAGPGSVHVLEEWPAGLLPMHEGQ